MDTATIQSEAFKQVLKEAITEALHEQRDLLYEVFADALEDFALAEAIQEGQQTEPATREDVLDILKGGPAASGLLLAF